MNRAIPSALLCALCAPTLAAAADGMGAAVAGGRLDLSLPPGAPRASAGSPAPASASILPDLGRPAGRSDIGFASDGRGVSPGGSTGPRVDLPYGAGYEARQTAGSQGRGGGRGR